MDVLYDMIGDVLDYAESELSIEECNLGRAEKEACEFGDDDRVAGIQDRVDTIKRVIQALEAAQGELY